MNSKSKLFVNPHGRLCEFKVKNKETLETGCFVLNAICSHWINPRHLNDIRFTFNSNYISKHQKW